MTVLFENLVEIKNWGLNSTTICFFLILPFIFLACREVTRYGRKIWRRKSTLAISPLLISYRLMTCLAIAIYGYYQESLILMLVGMPVIFDLRTVLGLLRFGNENCQNQTAMSLLYLAALPALMIIIPYKDVMLGVTSAGGLFFFGAQLWEMRFLNKSQAIEIKLIVGLIINSVIWIIYAHSLNNWVIMGFNIMSLTIFVLMLTRWLKLYVLEQYPQICSSH